MATRLWVEIIEKLITARVERADENGNFLAGGYDLFAMKLGAAPRSERTDCFSA